MTERRAGRFRGKRVGVLMGGLSAEREISLKTGGAVLDALKSRGYDAVAIDAGRDLPARVAAEKIEAAFIALHGRYGEDGCVQGLLEVMGVPYTGSGVRASSTAMNKAAAKRLFEQCGIPTPRGVTIGAGPIPRGLKPPLVVKPACQGSAIGVGVARTARELKEAVKAARGYGDELIAEEFLEGRELTVSILDGRVLPLIEIRPKGGLYDYKAKYTKGMTEFIVPAKVDGGVKKAVVRAAADAYAALGCSGAARADVMLNKRSKPFVLEMNTVPGLTELSLFPRAAAAAGMDYATLVETMLDGAGLEKL